MATAIPATQNTAPAEPTLKDLLDLTKKQILLGLNCHHLGTVQSFNPINQTAVATVNYPQTYMKFNSATGLYNPMLVNYAQLVDCPVISLGGGTAALTLPITKGDECLVLFNDRDINNWFQNGAGAPVATSRLHSFSDGLILVGVRSLPNVLAAYDTARALLRNGTNGSTQVGVSATKVRIANQASGTLGVSFGNFLTALNTFITTTSVATTAIQIAAAAVTFKPAVTTFQTAIGGLLE